MFWKGKVREKKEKKKEGKKNRTKLKRLNYIPVLNLKRKRERWIKISSRWKKEKVTCFEGNFMRSGFNLIFKKFSNGKGFRSKFGKKLHEIFSCQREVTDLRTRLSTKMFNKYWNYYEFWRITYWTKIFKKKKTYILIFQ